MISYHGCALFSGIDHAAGWTMGRLIQWEGTICHYKVSICHTSLTVDIVCLFPLALNQPFL